MPGIKDAMLKMKAGLTSMGAQPNATGGDTDRMMKAMMIQQMIAGKNKEPQDYLANLMAFLTMNGKGKAAAPAAPQKIDPETGAPAPLPAPPAMPQQGAMQPPEEQIPLRPDMLPPDQQIPLRDQTYSPEDEKMMVLRKLKEAGVM